MLRASVRLLVVLTALAGPLAAQGTVPELTYASTGDFLRLPDHLHLGEVAGVASNSKGHLFVYTRSGNPTASLGTSRVVTHGGSRLFEFDPNGKFVRELGQGVYGFLSAQSARVDREDHVWVVDQQSNQVMKFNPAGRVVMVLGRKPEVIRVPGAPAPAGPPPGAPGGGGGPGGQPVVPGAGNQGETFTRPTDVAWDATGNIFVSDGLGANARVAKYDRYGKFLKTFGSRGAGPGQFDRPSSLAVDAQGHVYVADRENGRIQVFDGEGTFEREIKGIGKPAALCISSGAHPYLYSSNSNSHLTFDEGGEIYKLELDGRIVGRFGRAGKLPKEFGTVNSLDCRTDSVIFVGELANWRVQKLTLAAR